MKDFTSTLDILKSADRCADLFFQQYPQLLDTSIPLKARQIMLENCMSNIDKLDKVLDLKKKHFSLGVSEEEEAAMSSEEHKQYLKDIRPTKRVIAEGILHGSITLGTMHGILENYFDSLEDIKAFMDNLEEQGFFTFDAYYKKFVINPVLKLSEADQNQLEWLQTNIPMICKPKKVSKKPGKSARNGYLTKYRALVSRHADKTAEIPLDTLNLQNGFSYCINYDAWYEFLCLAYEDPAREKDMPDDKYIRTCQLARLFHFKKAFMVEIYHRMGVEEIHILNFFDYRGRNYPLAYCFNPQGRDLEKAMLCFKPRPINHIGMKWLRISIANNFNCKVEDPLSGEKRSLDKLRFEQRLQWFYDNLEKYLELDFKSFKTKLVELQKEAESPACFLVQFLDLWKANQMLIQGKQPMSSAITHWDATASGFQLQAICACDVKMATLTNAINNALGVRQDLYTSLFQDLQKLGIPETFVNDNGDKITFNRTEAKMYCFIPAGYSSTLSPKNYFGEKYAGVFFGMMDQYPFWRMSQAFPNLWSTTAYDYFWHLPDNFQVHKVIKGKVTAQFNYGDIEYNVVKSLDRRQWHKPEEIEPFSKELGPNMIHSIDGFIMREVIRTLCLPRKHIEWVKVLMANKSKWLVNQKKDLTESDLAERALMSKLVSHGEESGYYSLVIVSETKPSNIDLVPTDVLEELLALFPEEECPLSAIHDSFGVPPDMVDHLLKAYKTCLYKISKSCLLPWMVYNYCQSVGFSEKDSATTASFFHANDEKFSEAILKEEFALC